jgi:hypothetical protein
VTRKDLTVPERLVTVRSRRLPITAGRDRTSIP